MSRKLTNADNRLYETLINLKRHLGSCAPCRVARKGDDPYMMCRMGIEMVVRAASFYDVLISLRVEARNSDDTTVYPCPSIRAHGRTYEMTAMPVVVIGYQGKLF